MNLDELPFVPAGVEAGFRHYAPAVRGWEVAKIIGVDGFRIDVWRLPDYGLYHIVAYSKWGAEKYTALTILEAQCVLLELTQESKMDTQQVDLGLTQG